MKKYPSRIRYEKSHPTISFRLNKELKKRLEQVLEGKSFADFVKEGLGVREREKKSLEEAHVDGYSDGYEEAKNKFAVQAPCAICGKTMFMHSDEAKEKLAEYVISREAGEWCHTGCIEDERKSRR